MVLSFFLSSLLDRSSADTLAHLFHVPPLIQNKILLYLVFFQLVWTCCGSYFPVLSTESRAPPLSLCRPGELPITVRWTESHTSCCNTVISEETPPPFRTNFKAILSSCFPVLLAYDGRAVAHPCIFGRGCWWVPQENCFAHSFLERLTHLGFSWYLRKRPQWGFITS